jgi:cytochrome c oxidase subunit II
MARSWARSLLILLFIPIRVLAGTEAGEQVIKVTAKKFEFSPSVIAVHLNVPVVLEFTSLDRLHGFAVPDLKLEAEIKPGETTRVRFVPDKLGTFPFRCNRFCGSGHEDMNGQIVVAN